MTLRYRVLVWRPRRPWRLRRYLVTYSASEGAWRMTGRGECRRACDPGHLLEAACNGGRWVLVIPEPLGALPDAGDELRAVRDDPDIAAWAASYERMRRQSTVPPALPSPR